MSTAAQRYPNPRRAKLPYMGAGVALRRAYHGHIMDARPAVSWFEVLTENYLQRGGAVQRELEAIANQYPVATHGVAMSVGGTDPLDWDHLRHVRAFNRSIGALWTSEHLCFSAVDHRHLNNLMPLPFTEEAVDHVASRVRVVQDYLEIPFLLENVTYYMVVSGREMTELEFINAVLEQADCGLLLDVANVYINARNQGYDADRFIAGLPAERIGQIHLAGQQELPGLVKDTHSAPVPEKVWTLFREALSHCGPVNANVEWDMDLPAWEALHTEARKTQAALEACERTAAWH